MIWGLFHQPFLPGNLLLNPTNVFCFGLCSTHTQQCSVHRFCSTTNIIVQTVKWDLKKNSQEDLLVNEAPISPTGLVPWDLCTFTMKAVFLYGRLAWLLHASTVFLLSSLLLEKQKHIIIGCWCIMTFFKIRCPSWPRTVC